MLETSCANLMRAHNMLKAGDKVLVALSGGPDSVALLHHFWSIAKPRELELCAVHVNHMLRGSQSDGDEEFCVKFCDNLGIPLSVRTLDVNALKRTARAGTQAVARAGRFNILMEEARKSRANKVAIAQNMDDQAETVLQRLVRGTGPDGIAGIWPSRRFDATHGFSGAEIIRPLLATDREEIIEYLKRHALSYRLDASNLEPVYTRNRMRIELMPMLREYNPEVVRALARFAGLAHEQNTLMRELLEPMERFILVDDSGARIQIEDLASISRALRRHLLRRAIERARGSLRRISQAHVEMAEAVFEGRKRVVEIPGLKVYVRKNRLVFAKTDVLKPNRCGLPEPVAVAIPGKSEIPRLGICIVSTLKERGPFAEMPVFADNPMHARLDWDRMTPPIGVRTRRPGDRFYPLGLGGSKKLKDFLISKKIDISARDSLPVFTDASGAIIWVSGVEIDDRFKITDETRNVLEIEILQHAKPQ